MFFPQNGIFHESTCVETPQQNYVAKLKRCHILNVACCLHFHAHIPISFWGECILAATYLINCTPSPILTSKLPHELLFNKPTSYTHLHLWLPLVASVMLTFFCLIMTSSLHVPYVVFLLVIIFIIKHIEFMIWRTIAFSSPMMSLSLNIFFPFNTYCPILLQTLSSLSPSWNPNPFIPGPTSSIIFDPTSTMPRASLSSLSLAA